MILSDRIQDNQVYQHKGNLDKVYQDKDDQDKDKDADNQDKDNQDKEKDNQVHNLAMVAYLVLVAKVTMNQLDRIHLGLSLQIFYFILFTRGKFESYV